LGVIPISVEKSASDLVNALLYTGLMEKHLDIAIETIVTDRCNSIIKDEQKVLIKIKLIYVY
jgi:hypothetical protein